MLKSPAKVVSIVPPRTRPERIELKVLDAYVETIRLWSSQPTQAETIRFEHTEVEVLPWAARAILRFCNAPHPTHGEIEDLVTQGVAVIAKCRTDLAETGSQADNMNVTYARQAEMMLDAAVGSVVVRELQKLGNNLLARGDNEDVKELNRFQHEVRRTVQQIRGSLSETEKARASEFAELIRGGQDDPGGGEFGIDKPAVQDHVAGTPAAPVETKPAPGRSTLTAQPVQEHEKRPRIDKPVVTLKDGKGQRGHLRSYLMRFVLTVMIVGLATYGVSRLRNDPVQGDASGSLTTAVASMPGVTEVTDRMPYIVLTVHDDFWAERGDSARKDWIRELSRMTERHGYSSLVVRSTDGTPLAEWVRGRGIKFGSS